MINRSKFLKLKNIKELEKRIEADIQKQMFRKQTAQGVAKIIVDSIKNGEKFSAKVATRNIRSQLERYNKTDPTYQREKINFTFTGDLLNDLVKNVKRLKHGKKTLFHIGHSGRKHRAYRGNTGKKGAKKKPTLSFLQIYDNLKKLNPKFAYLSRSFRKRRARGVAKFPGKTSKNIVKFLKKRIIDFYHKR